MQAGDDSTEIDLYVDYRLLPAEPSPLGPVLSIEELAANKLLALFSRAEARDFVDVAALEPVFGLGRLYELAREKDAGFDPTVLAGCWAGSTGSRKTSSSCAMSVSQRFADRCGAGSSNSPVLGLAAGAVESGKTDYGSDGGVPHPPPPGVSIRRTSPAFRRSVHLSGSRLASRS